MSHSQPSHSILPPPTQRAGVSLADVLATLTLEQREHVHMHNNRLPTPDALQGYITNEALQSRERFIQFRTAASRYHSHLLARDPAPEPQQRSRVSARSSVEPNFGYADLQDVASLEWEMERASRRTSLPYTVSSTLRCMPHMAIIRCRQARALAGLDTSEIDTEIARRVLTQPQRWRGAYFMMERLGIVNRVRRYREAEIERVEDERTDPSMESLESVGTGEEHERARLGRRW